MDPIAYQTRANSNRLDDFDIKRTTFYAQKDKQNLAQFSGNPERVSIMDPIAY